TKTLLIEDSAQWFPEPLDAPLLTGDVVVLSFGRGKPVSLLGGGALLVEESLWPKLPVDRVCKCEPDGRAWSLALRAYNALLHPSLCALVSRNRVFPLGRTMYRPLRA